MTRFISHQSFMVTKFMLDPVVTQYFMLSDEFFHLVYASNIGLKGEIHGRDQYFPINVSNDYSY